MLIQGNQKWEATISGVVPPGMDQETAKQFVIANLCGTFLLNQFTKQFAVTVTPILTVDNQGQ